MNQLKRCCIALLVLPLALNLRAQPILVQPQQQAFGGNSLSNLRLRNQSTDGTSAILTVDFSYDGINGPTARLLPAIADKKQTKVSGWFGADPVTISTGRGTISLRIKFFNDEPGVPPELTTDHVKVIMLNDGGNTLISQGLFAQTIKWGGPNAQPAKALQVETPDQAQLQAQEKARQEAEAKTRQEARLKAEAKQIAEQKAKAEAEAKQIAEQKAKAEAEAKQIAEQKAKAEAEAKRTADEKARAEAEATRLAEQKAKAVATASHAAPAKAAFVLASNIKTKISNIDVVNRNIDRTEMTIAVEYQYAKEDGLPRMGVDVASTEEPGASGCFSSPVLDIGRGSRGFVMFPVKLNVAASQNLRRATLPTDKVWIYLADAGGAKSYVFQSTMILVWHIPGVEATATPAANRQNTIEIDSFRQNGLFSGYVTVKYNLAAGAGAKLRLKVYDSANPATVDWFSSDDVAITSGPGVQLVRIAVPKEAPSPDVFNVDTVEVQMLDEKGAVTASVKKQTTMSWAKPK